MPFTLAHPAAVLPFRRYCPQWLSFPALVAGSLSPDIGYCFRAWNLDELSHTLIGSLKFCLPAGVVLLGIFYALRHPAVKLLPERHRKYFIPFCRLLFGSPVAVIVSLLVGIWIHLLLDSLTHKDGWLVINLPVLQAPLFSAGRFTFRIFNLLWYALSFVGIAWLYLAWEQWCDRVRGLAPQAASLGQWTRAVVAGALMVPVELTHHLVAGPVGIFLIAGYGGVLLIGFFWSLGHQDLAKG